jgi:hypothetical protein
MENSDPTLTIILAEISLILFFLLTAMIITLTIKRRRKTVQVAKIIEQLEDSRKERQQKLSTEISAASRIRQDELNSIVEDIGNKETDIHKAILVAYIKGDTNTLESLGNEMHTISTHYIKAIKLAAKTNSEKEPDEKDQDNQDNIPDVDDAVDDMLSNESELTDADSDFDLSNTDDLPDDELPEMDADTIAEIPDDLLNSN